MCCPRMTTSQELCKRIPGGDTNGSTYKGGGLWVISKVLEGYLEDPTSHLSIPSFKCLILSTVCQVLLGIALVREESRQNKACSL